MGGLRAGVQGRWVRLPLWARGVLAIYFIGLVDGTIDHVVWMAGGGIHAYARFGNVAIQLFLVLLIVLDPVTALDVPANWAGNWHAMPGFLVTFWPGEVFAVFVFATAVPLARALAPHGGTVATGAAV